MASTEIISTDQISIRQLVPGDEAALEEFLRDRLDSSMFLLGNMRHAGLVDSGERLTGTYVAALVDGAIVGVVAHYWNDNLICQAPVALNQLWREAVARSGRPLAGIIGLAEQVKQISDQLGITAGNSKINSAEGLFSLDLANLIVPDPLTSGVLVGRRMEEADLPQLRAWRAAYICETLGETDIDRALEDAHAAMIRSLAEGSTWVLEADGQRVAMTSFNAMLAEAVQVGGVYTPPAWRRRGYARAVVAASLRDIHTKGVGRAILFTGDDHVAAQTAYRALGFQRIGDWGLLLLKAPIVVE